MTAEINVELKNTFTKEEIEAMKEPQCEPLRFLIEGEDGKEKFNAYRIKPENGIAYCNRECNKIFEKQEGILRLRIFTRIDFKEFKQIAYAERTKDVAFDQLLIVD
jgi:hypothetical protein